MAKKEVEEGSQMDLDTAVDVAEGKTDLKVVKKKSKKGTKNVMQEFQDDEEVKKLVREMRERRQSIIEAKIQEEFTPEDWEKFKTFKELHEYLFTKGRLEIMERGTHYDNAEFGVKIYGDEHWFSEKETKTY